MRCEADLQQPRPGKKRLQGLIAASNTYVDNAHSMKTRKSYASDISLFKEWCQEQQLVDLPADPQTVCLYLVELADRNHAVATIQRRLIAIGSAHRAVNQPDPTQDVVVRGVVKGIRRTLGTQQTKKAPLRNDELLSLLKLLPLDIRGARDRAILALGFAGALRRSELASLDVAWIHAVRGGVEVRLPVSKADQERHGVAVIVERGRSSESCPVQLLRAYLKAAKIVEGPIFRKIDRHGNVASSALTPDSITRLVKSRIALVATESNDYGAHSLRAGFATVLDEHGATLTQIMRRGRWKSERVARGYIRSESWKDDIGTKLGL